jgi:hypothetical protein
MPKALIPAYPFQIPTKSEPETTKNTARAPLGISSIISRLHKPVLNPMLDSLQE